MQKSNLLSLDSAIEKIRSNFEIVSSEDVFLQNALGRCLSKPVISKINPPIFDTKLIFFLKFLENIKNLCIKYPDKINGIAKPNE